MPYDFDPDTEQDFSKMEKEAIQDSIAKFNEELNGCLRIVQVLITLGKTFQSFKVLTFFLL